MVIQTPEDPRKRRSKREDEEGNTGDGGTHTGKPPEAVRDLGAGQVRQRGDKRTRNGRRFRHAAWGAETSDRGWQRAGVEYVQVDGVPRREKRWGAGDTESEMMTNGYIWGEVGWRKGKNITIHKQLRRVGRVGL